MSAIKKVGRPTIANSEVPAHIFEGLLHKSRGRTWADSATAVGIKYQTLKEWVNENEVARQFYKEQLKARIGNSSNKFTSPLQVILLFIIVEIFVILSLPISNLVFKDMLFIKL